MSLVSQNTYMNAGGNILIRYRMSSGKAKAYKIRDRIAIHAFRGNTP